MSQAKRYSELVVINVLRMVYGFLFWQHGVQKLFGEFGRTEAVEFFSLLGLAGLLETVGGFLIFIGLFTRPTAFILSGQMAWAYFQTHAPDGFWPIMNGGELAALYAFIFLYLAARGGGALSVDAALVKVKERRAARALETASASQGVQAPRDEGSAAPPPDDFPDDFDDDFDDDDLDIEELLRDD